TGPPPLCMLSLLMPRPPRSPLFPYTTLFRSKPCQAIVRYILVIVEHACDALRFRLGWLPAWRCASTTLELLAHHGLSYRPHCHRSEEHTSELQSRENLVCRLLLEKKKQDSAT